MSSGGACNGEVSNASSGGRKPIAARCNELKSKIVVTVAVNLTCFMRHSFIIIFTTNVIIFLIKLHYHSSPVNAFKLDSFFFQFKNT